MQCISGFAKLQEHATLTIWPSKTAQSVYANSRIKATNRICGAPHPVWSKYANVLLYQSEGGRLLGRHQVYTVGMALHQQIQAMRALGRQALDVSAPVHRWVRLVRQVSRSCAILWGEGVQASMVSEGAPPPQLLQPAVPRPSPRETDESSA
jgi:hypothetical protein